MIIATMKILKTSTFLTLALCTGLTAGFARAMESQHPSIGPGIVVHPKMGGLIFGFDIDPNSNVGVLSEFSDTGAATETFDQTTGEILAVVANSTNDDFVTLGVVGHSVGLVEREHSLGLFHVQRTYNVLDPVGGNTVTGVWTPPLGRKQNIDQVKTDVGTSEVAVLALDFSGHGNNTIFTSDVAANTFGPSYEITDTDFNFEGTPFITFDSKNNQVILGHNARSPFIVPPEIGFLDLATGAFTKFAGKGLGLINGMAVDSEDGILCTTVSFVPTVQFYDLATRKGFSVRLPNAGDSLSRGQEVVFDPVNKLFLVAQEFTSTGSSGSSIHIFDLEGHLVESIDGLNFINPSRVIPGRIALHPAQRSGFCEGPAEGRTLQGFTY